jgi:hypothetical protein
LVPPFPSVRSACQRKSKFTAAQIVAILREAEAGVALENLASKEVLSREL